MFSRDTMKKNEFSGGNSLFCQGCNSNGNQCPVQGSQPKNSFWCCQRPTQCSNLYGVDCPRCLADNTLLQGMRAAPTAPCSTGPPVQPPVQKQCPSACTPSPWSSPPAFQGNPCGAPFPPFAACPFATCIARTLATQAPAGGVLVAFQPCGGAKKPSSDSEKDDSDEGSNAEYHDQRVSTVEEEEEEDDDEDEDEDKRKECKRKSNWRLCDSDRDDNKDKVKDQNKNRSRYKDKYKKEGHKSKRVLCASNVDSNSDKTKDSDTDQNKDRWRYKNKDSDEDKSKKKEFTRKRDSFVCSVDSDGSSDKNDRVKEQNKDRYRYKNKDNNEDTRVSKVGSVGKSVEDSGKVTDENKGRYGYKNKVNDNDKYKEEGCKCKRDWIDSKAVDSLASSFDDSSTQTDESKGRYKDKVDETNKSKENINNNTDNKYCSEKGFSFDTYTSNNNYNTNRKPKTSVICSHMHVFTKPELESVYSKTIPIVNKSKSQIELEAKLSSISSDLDLQDEFKSASQTLLETKLQTISTQTISQIEPPTIRHTGSRPMLQTSSSETDSDNDTQQKQQLKYNLMPKGGPNALCVFPVEETPVYKSVYVTDPLTYSTYSQIFDVLPDDLESATYKIKTPYFYRGMKQNKVQNNEPTSYGLSSSTSGTQNAEYQEPVYSFRWSTQQVVDRSEQIPSMNRTLESHKAEQRRLFSQFFRAPVEQIISESKEVPCLNKIPEPQLTHVQEEPASSRGDKLSSREHNEQLWHPQSNYKVGNSVYEEQAPRRVYEAKNVDYKEYPWPRFADPEAWNIENKKRELYSYKISEQDQVNHNEQAKGIRVSNVGDKEKAPSMYSLEQQTAGFKKPIFCFSRKPPNTGGRKDAQDLYTKSECDGVEHERQALCVYKDTNSQKTDCVERARLSHARPEAGDIEDQGRNMCYSKDSQFQNTVHAEQTLCRHKTPTLHTLEHVEQPKYYNERHELQDVKYEPQTQESNGPLRPREDVSLRDAKYDFKCPEQSIEYQEEVLPSSTIFESQSRECREQDVASYKTFKNQIDDHNVYVSYTYAEPQRRFCKDQTQSFVDSETQNKDHNVPVPHMQETPKEKSAAPNKMIPVLIRNPKAQNGDYCACPLYSFREPHIIIYEEQVSSSFTNLESLCEDCNVLISYSPERSEQNNRDVMDKCEGIETKREKNRECVTYEHTVPEDSSSDLENQEPSSYENTNSQVANSESSNKTSMIQSNPSKAQFQHSQSNPVSQSAVSKQRSESSSRECDPKTARVHRTPSRVLQKRGRKGSSIGRETSDNTQCTYQPAQSRAPPTPSRTVYKGPVHRLSKPRTVNCGKKMQLPGKSPGMKGDYDDSVSRSKKRCKSRRVRFKGKPLIEYRKTKGQKEYCESMALPSHSEKGGSRSTSKSRISESQSDDEEEESYSYRRSDSCRRQERQDLSSCRIPEAHSRDYRDEICYSHISPEQQRLEPEELVLHRNRRSDKESRDYRNLSPFSYQDPKPPRILYKENSQYLCRHEPETGEYREPIPNSHRRLEPRNRKYRESVSSLPESKKQRTSDGHILSPYQELELQSLEYGEISYQNTRRKKHERDYIEQLPYCKTFEPCRDHTRQTQYYYRMRKPHSICYKEYEQEDSSDYSTSFEMKLDSPKVKTREEASQTDARSETVSKATAEHATSPYRSELPTGDSVENQLFFECSSEKRVQFLTERTTPSCRVLESQNVVRNEVIPFPYSEDTLLTEEPKEQALSSHRSSERQVVASFSEVIQEGNLFVALSESTIVPTPTPTSTSTAETHTQTIIGGIKDDQASATKRTSRSSLSFCPPSKKQKNMIETTSKPVPPGWNSVLPDLFEGLPSTVRSAVCLQHTTGVVPMTLPTFLSSMSIASGTTLVPRQNWSRPRDTLRFQFPACRPGSERSWYPWLQRCFSYPMFPAAYSSVSGTSVVPLRPSIFY